jgi:hypothetical protein
VPGFRLVKRALSSRYVTAGYTPVRALPKAPGESALGCGRWTSTSASPGAETWPPAIYRQLLDAILDGRLRSGERLPPSRDLAQRLEVSRNTVAVAYERLTAEGFLVSRVGAGTYVSTEPLGRLRSRAAPAGSGVLPRAVWRTLPVPALGESTVEHDFGVGVPDGRFFPIETWRRLVTREMRASTVRSAGYSDPRGHAGLRAAIARHIGVARSVRAGADDVLVTHGAQQALDLIGRVLIEPGGTVAVEEPGYWPARLLFQSLGARVVGVPVDGEGIDVAATPAAVRGALGGRPAPVRALHSGARRGRHVGAVGRRRRAGAARLPPRRAGAGRARDRVRRHPHRPHRRGLAPLGCGLPVSPVTAGG